jgi:cytochrome c oxidase subunit 2
MSRGILAMLALAGAAAIALVTALSGTALAGMGVPTPGEMTMQEPATPVAVSIHEFYDLVTWIIVAISLFVLALLVVVMLRFNARANPTPSRNAHNTVLEVAWTVIPILVLVIIAIPSFKLLNLEYAYPKPDLVIKATANAWFWEHQYVDKGGFTVTSNMIRDDDVIKAEIGDKEFEKRYGPVTDELVRVRMMYEDSKNLYAKQGLVRQLSVDNEIAVPVGKVVHLLVTSNDVIHQWVIPSFGSKQQAVPGRVAATWFKPTVTGIFYGQCSVLCGRDHASMPIAVRVVSEQAFNDWSAALKARDTKKAKAILKAEADRQNAAKVASAN